MLRYLKCSSFTNFSFAYIYRRYPGSILSFYLEKARHVIAPRPAKCSRVSREKTRFSSREIKVGNKSPGGGRREGLVGVVNLTLTSLERFSNLVAGLDPRIGLVRFANLAFHECSSNLHPHRQINYKFNLKYRNTEE